MKRVSTTSLALAPTDTGAVGKAWDEVSASFDRFCLAAGVDALGAMMEKDAEEACGARHARSQGRRGHRWGRTHGKIGFHAGKVAIERPRVRDLAGQELALPSWERAVAEDWLGKWAMNLMLINVSTRKFRRAVRLPEGDVPAPTGAGVSKSAASRHFVALSAARMKEWMGADLSKLDIWPPGQCLKQAPVHRKNYVRRLRPRATLGDSIQNLQCGLGHARGSPNHPVTGSNYITGSLNKQVGTGRNPSPRVGSPAGLHIPLD